MIKFINRSEAGKLLASQIDRAYNIVLALPRGGVPVAKEIADALHLPLDVYVVRKLGSPHNRELGIGAIAEPEIVMIDDHLVAQLGITDEEIVTVLAKEKIELQRRIATSRNNQPLPVLENERILVVDDGVATGITAKAAITGIRANNPYQVTFAAPVCSLSAYKELEVICDNVVCLLVDDKLRSVGAYYESFNQFSDEEVQHILSGGRIK